MENKSLHHILRIFISMKTALFLLAVIILCSIAGTIIPQERTVTTAGPVFRFLYYTLNFGDIYHSSWFSFLLFCLCLNLAVCSFSRLPTLWKATFSQPVWPNPIGWQQEIRMNTSCETALATIRLSLEKAGFRTQNSQSNRIYARKGQIAPWGTLLVHISVLLIASGAFYGSVNGFRYTIQLTPGETVVIGSSDYPGAGQSFSLALKNFATERYSNGQVSDWISSLEIIQDGKTTAAQDVKVNHPLSYQGISFYQSSYTNVYQARLRFSGLPDQTIQLQEKQPYILDDQQGIAVMPVRYLPDFDPQNPMVSRSPNPVNPHIIYLTYAGGRPLGMNAIPMEKTISLPGSPLEFIFHSVQEASGLEVKYDPGLPVVFSGFILMSLAFFASLYPQRRTVYVEIRPNGNTALLSIAMFGKTQLPEEELQVICQSIMSEEENRSARGARYDKL
ncbi:MAG: ccsB [Firmicutes bacterium]|nr:ccsB [Bacillota bacterium]